jgi:hypothetical protein
LFSISVRVVNKTNLTPCMFISACIAILIVGSVVRSSV